MEAKMQKPELLIQVGRIGIGTSTSLRSAPRRVREAAREEARWTGTAHWTVRDETGRVLADGIETA